MKNKKKIIVALFILAIIMGILFFSRMKKFADGVRKDAKEKKDFNEKEISDSTKMIFKKG